MREFPAFLKGSSMARTKKGTPPSYPSRPHKGQARITGSTESRKEYQRVLAELEAGNGALQVKEGDRFASDLTVAEMLVRFWRHAEDYYCLLNGRPSRELDHYRLSLGPVLDLYGDTLAREFGPLALKAVRQHMQDARQYLVRRADKPDSNGRWLGEEKVRLEESTALVGPDEKKGWVKVEVLKERQALCRKVINQRIDHVRRVFRWAASEELVPQAVYQALTTVAGLRRGQRGTRDKPRVRPVSDEVVEATLPFLRPQVRAMVQVQRLTGARPTEVCLMRGRDIDRSGPVWWYRIDPNEVPREGQPANLHKTAHHEDGDGHAQVKLLPIGPKAQAILAPFLRRDPNAFLFQPCEAKQELNKEKKDKRKTPRWPSHLRAQEAKRKVNPKRAPRDHYDRHSYAHAISRAARKADKVAHEKDKTLPAEKVVVPHWHPHQLKHAIATEVRRRHGAEAAQVYVGHANLSTTEIYAEKDLRKIEEIALEVG
jgi:integrase